MDTPLIIDKECRNLYNLGSKIKWISEKEQGMAGKGRPTVDDKRDNQYRVRLNDEENQMLAYCSEKTGQPKSQIFRRALESYFQTVQLNELEMETDGISMKRVIKCPHCGASNELTLLIIAPEIIPPNDRWVRKSSTVSTVKVMNVSDADRPLE